MERRVYLERMVEAHGEMLRWIASTHLPYPGSNLSKDEEVANLAFLESLDARCHTILQPHFEGLTPPEELEEMHHGLMVGAGLRTPEDDEAIGEMALFDLVVTCREDGVEFPDGDEWLADMLALLEEAEQQGRI